MFYFDTSYVVRLYVKDPGWVAVRELAEKHQIACSVHGKTETVAAFHRKLRERILTRKQFSILCAEFENDSAAGAFHWLSVGEAVTKRVAEVFLALPATVSLRAADAIHLASASVNQFAEIYSNDQRLLAAAVQFAVKGSNII